MRNVWKRNRVLAACLATLAFACGASGCVTQEGERPAPAPAVRTPAIDRPDETRLPESVRRWRRANGERPGTFERIEGGALYLLVNLGEKPTGGYGVRVEEAFLEGKRLLAVVRVERPDSGQAVTQSVTYPSDLVRIEATPDQVTYAFTGDVAWNLPAAPAEAEGEGEAERREEESASRAEREAVAASDAFRLFHPAPGTAVRSPLRVEGEARVFEGAFAIDLVQGERLLARRHLQVGGAPAWSPFRTELTFDAPAGEQTGELILWYGSARDGSRVESLRVPVRFTAAGR